MRPHFLSRAGSWLKRAGRRMGLCLLALVIACTLATQLRAFKIGFSNWLPIHEMITGSAIRSAMPQANPLFVSNVNNGVFNTDLSHQPIAAFHFDNSTTTSGGFQDGFQNGFDKLHEMLATAAGDAQICCDASGNYYINPLFLNPQHSSYRDLAEDIVGTYLDLSVNASCLTELACPTDQFVADAAHVQAEVLPILLDTDPDPDEVAAYTFQAPIGNNCCSLDVPNFAETVAEVMSNLGSLLGQHCRPDWAGGQCFDVLEDMCTDDNNYQLLAGHLRILQYEYQAYYGWQHLGHAFHTTQDFFAHSNYVELAAGYHGPPCGNSSYPQELCDSPLSSNIVTDYAAIPLPTDSAFPWSLSDFQDIFSTQSVKRTLGEQNFARLQTGFFDLVQDACKSDFDMTSTGKSNTGTVAPLRYCHYQTASTPGLNKDEPQSPTGEPAHQNHQWAVVSATRMSVRLFCAFMANLAPPSGFNLLSPSAAMLGAQPRGAILSRGNTPAHLGGVVRAGNNLPQTIDSTPFQNLNSVQQPTTPATRSGLPGTLTGPLRPELSKQFPPHPVTIAGRPAVIRSLPHITRPELLQPNPRPHIFVKTFPNRAFRPGERVTLRVDAFDAKTGVQLHDLPVAIGSVRGLTSRPIALTISATTTQRCGAIGGQQFCLNVATPSKGMVAVPAERYPGGGGSFTLSVVSPKLLAGVVAGPVIRPGTTFTVTALDAHTHRVVSGAEVFLGQTRIGQANQPIAYHLPALMPIRARNRMGSMETLAASFGPPMIVRAPGYSDQLVRYVLSSVTP